MKNHYQKGISALEILVVVAVIGIIFAVVIPQFSKTRELQVLKSGVQDILSSIDKARGETLSSLNSSSYGVHLQSDKIIIFKGTVFSSGDANNETINIIKPANITNVTLGGTSGTSGDFYFNRLSGVPSTTGTITIGSTSYSKIITISATGAASSN
jgi:Tfp pilus assembly protein FimT